jgi:hypothetical protein
VRAESLRRRSGRRDANHLSSATALAQRAAPPLRRVDEGPRRAPVDCEGRRLPAIERIGERGLTRAEKEGESDGAKEDSPARTVKAGARRAPARQRPRRGAPARDVPTALLACIVGGSAERGAERKRESGGWRRVEEGVLWSREDTGARGLLPLSVWCEGECSWMTGLVVVDRGALFRVARSARGRADLSEQGGVGARFADANNGRCLWSRDAEPAKRDSL